MFGFGKRRSSGNSARVAEPAEGHPVIAALLLAGEAYPLQELQRAITRTQFRGMAAEGVEVKDGILMFQFGDEIVGVAHMPVPYPWSDLEGPVATAWMWPRERRPIAVKANRSHLLLSLIGGSAGRIERRLALTQITALAAKTGGAGVLGVYWAEGTLVHYPPVFVEMAAAVDQPDAPPLYLWVDFRVFRNQDGSFGLFTTGLRRLGILDFEIPQIAMKPGGLRQWALNIAYYLLENGNRVMDGDTIGMSAEQKIRIRHTPSSFGGKETVMQLQV